MTTKTFLTSSLAAAVLAGTLSVAGASAADAAAPDYSSLSGSIVFIKRHNVWLANGSGGGQYQVTFDGTSTYPYRSPSQSDTGVIVASHHHDIVRMTQNGTVLGSINPLPLDNSVGEGIDGPPMDLAISPDGSKVAYTFYSYGCPIGTDCTARTSSAVTDAAALTPSSRYGETFFATSSWIGNGRLLQSGGNGHHAELKDLGAAPRTWFNDYDYAASPTDLGDAELSPDGKWLGAVRGYGSNAHVVWFAVSGNPFTGAPPAVPALKCATSEQAGFVDPTWSPDSKALAWEEPDGVWLKDDAAGCAAVQPRLLIPGASEPDWSAAKLAPAARVFAVKAKPSFSGKPKVGATLSALAGSWSPSPTSIRIQWLRNGSPIKGATKASYKPTRADLGKKIAVRITASRAGYPAKAATSAAKKVKRA